MTNLELIQSFNVNEMATMLAQICHERDCQMLERLSAHGIDASLVTLPYEAQVEIHKNWLLEEIDDEPV